MSLSCELTGEGLYGIIRSSMYIPTQKERYSSVANFTLLLCVIAPSSLVAWFYTKMGFGAIMSAFTWPLALPLEPLLGSFGAGMLMATVLQLVAYLLLRRSKMEPKKKLTIAIIWGMGLALAVRILIAYAVYQAVLQSALSSSSQ